MYRIFSFHTTLIRLACLSCLFLVSAAMAQHEYPEVEVQRGGQFFRNACIACHGQNGDSLDDVSLADPVFLQGMTDEQLITIITTGVQGTAMLASTYSELQAGNIVAYLRDMSEQGRIAPVNGDAIRGQALVESGDCLDCHRIKRNGSILGPDLSIIGLTRRTSELEESILDPDVTILPENRTVRLVTENGDEITGKLLNHDLITVQLLDSNERLQSFAKNELREFEFILDSAMPSYANLLSNQEVEDILSYLVSLTGGDAQ